MKPLVIIEEAELYVADAHARYEEQRPGLGDKCLYELRAAIGRVHAEPDHCTSSASSMSSPTSPSSLRTLDPLLRFTRLPTHTLDNLFGDILTEDFP